MGKLWRRLCRVIYEVGRTESNDAMNQASAQVDGGFYGLGNIEEEWGANLEGEAEFTHRGKSEASTHE